MMPRDGSTRLRRPLRAAAGAEEAGSRVHDEWLLDEALMETFPASDPTAPAIVSAPPALQLRGAARPGDDPGVKGSSRPR